LARARRWSKAFERPFRAPAVRAGASDLKRDLGRLTDREHDVLIVGGGISGATAAWDAAQRGLSVALIEAADFGSGTSWNSLKTIHGGLRHLQRLDLAGHRESVRERAALLRIAPGLVKPQAFVIPVYGHGFKGREAFWGALRLHDLLSADRTVPGSRMLSRSEVLSRLPGLETRGLSGGALWFDAQMQSSERLLMAFLHAASEAGAVLCNYVKAVDFSAARPVVVATDAETDGTFEVRAKVVVNTAGPGMDAILRLAGVESAPVSLLRASNLVLGRPVVSDVALGARSGGRYLFVVPWQGISIVGTDYAPVDDDSPSRERAFLAEAASAFPWAGIREQDVMLVHRGLVPGRAGDDLGTRHAIVDHGARDGRPHLISVLAVKYTTARGVAQQVVDAVFRNLGRPSPPCRTADAPLAEARLSEGSLEERARRASRDEMALHLGDAVMRRLDLGTKGPPSPADLDVVTAALASEAGWDEQRASREREALAAELGRLRLGGSRVPD
jgi:glycerol-3-phosphate dehydrogenase